MEARVISLIKGNNTYAFRYAVGSESDVVDEILRQAEDEDCDLDWFDAATLSLQLTQFGAAPVTPSRRR